jgi:crotonobetaine/carnitine-CoA ligase
MLSPEIPQTCLWQAVERRAEKAPDEPVLLSGDVCLTARQLQQAAMGLSCQLAAHGIGRRSRVMTALPNSADHAILLLAITRLGAVWAAIAPDQRGPVLDHMVKTVEPDLIVASAETAAALSTSKAQRTPPVIAVPDNGTLEAALGGPSANVETESAGEDDVRAIVFTSGTTGPPKGAQVTERMLVASAWGAAHACDAAEGDRFLLWEPLYHIGGSQMLVLALLLPVELVIVPRFSASRFWQQIRVNRITKLHYLGGILDILLARPPQPDDRDHEVKLAFGAGARPETWQAFPDRFAIPLREVYGLTEASSFATVNRDGPAGSIGKTLPWMELCLVSDTGREVAAEDAGEIVIRPRVLGLLTPGYLAAPEASAAVIRNGALHTGDLACADGHGGYRFIGRKKDAIRVRGEMVSAWEVEAALLGHSEIVECAVIGVAAEIGEQEIMAYIRAVPDSECDLRALARWAAGLLPRRSRPRYWRLVADFPRTPSARIAKAELSGEIADAFDAGD